MGLVWRESSYFTTDAPGTEVLQFVAVIDTGSDPALIQCVVTKSAPDSRAWDAKIQIGTETKTVIYLGLKFLSQVEAMQRCETELARIGTAITKEVIFT